ncbi:MAG: heavy metal translocating P-type ATPase, partial [candidate division Zixibacteria bacterium]|nr:heavy metal translocating P-type ATPase [candidate division Zixibacteria bacterium]
MNKVVFKITGMDCAEEIAVLKKEIGPIVGGEKYLSFDILNGRMIILFQGAKLNQEEIVRAVGQTGMQAILWEEARLLESSPDDKKSHRRQLQAVFCIISGILLAAGFVSQAIKDGGILQVLSGTGEEKLVSALFYLGAAIMGAWFIVPKAFLAARRLRPDMNLLMTMAALGAIAIGQWFEAGTVTFLFSLALLLESWSINHARKAIGALLDLAPAKAHLLSPQSGLIEEWPVEKISQGMVVIVKPGEKIPLDGIIVSGSSSVNQSPITGESIPVSKDISDEVLAGTINNEGAFEFKVTKTAQDTTLARIIKMVEEAQSRRSPSERWVEKFARIYTPVMMIFAVLVIIIPPLFFGGLWERWFYEGLVILVIACPCALVISTPVSIVAGLTSAARSGVLIKGGLYLEIPARIKTMAFDKTGTITYGQPEVREMIPLSGHTSEELLARAAALESFSEHPLATAILRYATEKRVSLP